MPFARPSGTYQQLHHHHSTTAPGPPTAGGTTATPDQQRTTVHITTQPIASPPLFTAPHRTTPSPHIRPSHPPSLPSADPSRPQSRPHPSNPSTRKQIRRIPAPAILPPIVVATNSSLHLNLQSEAGSTLSTQVDELLSRHLQVPASSGGAVVAKKLHVPKKEETPRATGRNNSPLPPAVPSKSAISQRTDDNNPVMQESPIRRPASPAGPRIMQAQAQMSPTSSPKAGTVAAPGQGARRPLPVPPRGHEQTPHLHQTINAAPFATYQYPASYGPSVSKIRSLPGPPPRHTHMHVQTQPPLVAPSFTSTNSPYHGLPPGAAHFPHSFNDQNALGYGRNPHGPGQQQQQPQQFYRYNATQQMGIASPPPIPIEPAAKQSTISRTFAKGGASIFLHKGFFDLLSISPFTTAAAPATAAENVGNDDPHLASRQSAWNTSGWLGDKPVVPPPGTLRAVTSPAAVQHQHQQQQHAFTNSTAGLAPPASKGYRRISVDMISKPTGFTHLAHASDADEAAELLTRWRIDGKGKLAEPAWVAAIKEAARNRARARAVAQVQANIDEEHQKGSLKVVNANPESLVSIFTERAVNGSHDEAKIKGGLPVPATSNRPLPLPGLPLVSPDLLGNVNANPMDDAIIVHEDIPSRPILPPPTLRMNTTNTVVIRSAEALRALEGDEDASSNESPRHSPTSPRDLSSYPIRQPLPVQTGQVARKPFKPSLETVEKSVATKVFLENHYYGILKRPRDRDQRRAALERELAAANMTDSQRRKIRAAWMLAETEHLRSLRNRVTVNSFSKLKTIGHGAFGVVSLVREQGSGELYAMKKLRKADMLRKGQEGHVRAERDVMSAASSSAMSRWIVRLVYSFQDVDHLYLVMEYMGGGDLLNLLIEKDTFEEGFARFYIAEMVLAIQEAHKLGYIHRDIKPDNFIFSSDGHIKLSDFGLATDLHWSHDGAYYEAQRRQLLKKHGIDLDDGTGLSGGKRFNSSVGAVDLGDLPVMDHDDGSHADGGVLTIRDKQRKKLAYSVVGTNSYMSPEVIRGTGYDQSCDWWSLGVILFECLYGFPPFVSKSRHVTRQKILNWRAALRFPSRPKVSREAQDLITRLICERDERLGGRTAPSTIRPNAIVVQQRRSGFLGPAPAFPTLGDGAEDIKAHPWFRGLDFRSLHVQEPPFKPELRDPTDTRYFDEDINDEPLAAPDAQPGQAEATKDPMLRDKVHGKHLLDVRKQLAFQGYTFKSPRQRVYDPRNGLQDLANRLEEFEDARGRSTQREASSGFRRAMSL